MIVSTATAVLPVWRSPMINSRWPRPIGIIESIDLMPVCSGSSTGCRSIMPGAMRSMGSRSLVSMAPLPSSGCAQRINNATDLFLADRKFHNAAGPLDRVAFFDQRGVAKQHRADTVLVEVQRNAVHAVGELEEFLRHAVAEAVDARNAITNGDGCAYFLDLDLGFVAGDLLLNDARDFFGFDTHVILASRSVGGDPLAHLLQLVAQAAVVNDIPDAGGQTAEQVGVGLYVETYDAA